MDLLDLTEKNCRAILRGFPDTGAQWIANYPDFIRGLLKDWELSVVGKANGGWPTNIVYFVVDGKGHARVLKVGHPSPESLTESIVLSGANKRTNRLVQLLKQDRKAYALLLERIEPGYSLRDSIQDNEAIKAAMSLHLEVPRLAEAQDIAHLPYYSGWLEKAFLEYRAKPDPDDEFLQHIINVERIFPTLETSDQYVLHGDLHHENILQDGSGWIAIDPKGVIGPKAMELGRFLHNFMPDEIVGELSAESFAAVLLKRFNQAANQLPMTRRTLAEITYVDLTLAVTWTLNSEQNPKDSHVMLRALGRLVSELS